MKDLHQLAVTVRNTAKHLALNFDHTNIAAVHKLNLMANEIEQMKLNHTNHKETLDEVFNYTTGGTSSKRTSAKEISRTNTTKYQPTVITHKIRKITDIPTTEQIKDKRVAR